MGELKRVQVYDHTAGGYVDIHDPLKCEDCIRYGSIGDHYDADAVDAELTRLRAIEKAAREVINESYTDGFGGVGKEIIDELRVCGVHEALDALRAALGK